MLGGCWVMNARLKKGIMEIGRCDCHPQGRRATKHQIVAARKSRIALVALNLQAPSGAVGSTGDLISAKGKYRGAECVEDDADLTHKVTISNALLQKQTGVKQKEQWLEASCKPFIKRRWKKPDCKLRRRNFSRRYEASSVLRKRRESPRRVWGRLATRKPGCGPPPFIP